MSNILEEKINLFYNVLDDIQININKNLENNIINTCEYNNCMENINKLSETLNNLNINTNKINNINDNNFINDIQNINNILSQIIKSFGTYNFIFFFKICIDYDVQNLLKNNYDEKIEILNKYFHPLSYKVFNFEKKKNKLINNETDNNIINNEIDNDLTNDLTNDLLQFSYIKNNNNNNFLLKINGVNIIIKDNKNKRNLLIIGYFDNIILKNIKNKFINIRYKNLLQFPIINKINNELYDNDIWNNYIESLKIIDIIIYNDIDIFENYIQMILSNNILINKNINNIVQEFIGENLYNQRDIILKLLINNKQNMLYIAYLLYDILSCENTLSGDTTQQKIIYNSLPWICKHIFKEAMYKTIEYTSSLSNIDMENKIPIEQQICLMKVNENVKRKAMQKLKELKSKSEDSCYKARQYLDGLLKIPFGIYKEEYIFTKKKEINDLFNLLIKSINNYDINNINIYEIKNFICITKDLIKDSNSSVDIQNICETIETNLSPIYYNILNYILNDKKLCNKKNLYNILSSINIVNKNYGLENIKCKTNNNSLLINNIKQYLNINNNNKSLIKDILLLINVFESNNIYNNLITIDKTLLKINKKQNEIIDYICDFNKILDNAVHGHKNAKKQIERIIGQWINGENTGYCFGFEGAPGTGKTTLAKKGLSNCLKDKNGNSRPFAFIALGGSSNGSLLDGHNYTYVGSTWGKIVDILIEKQCMNPIIYIDELDKVSKTEYGKEIIGILTHLTDTTQNDTFQDKYFSNIDLDLSKALFIFSYNDRDLIDRILLDRIHTIKFDFLTLEDKIITTKDYLLPEFYKKFGLEDTIIFTDELIKYIIETYTNEPGVRKLKELLFEIISSINLDILKKTQKYKLPIVITRDIIHEILYERNNVRYLKINNISKIGIINGLWANDYGNGGILHIESKFFYAEKPFELKLTGLQGNVMKESMNVAMTVALNLINENQMKNILSTFSNTKMQGIHIHIPDGSIPKDGPSAGSAITLVIYSLLLNKKIRNNYALTGEINLQGNITAIGGLDLKILGGIKAGVTTFLYPKDNSKEFKLLYEKQQEKLEEYDFKEVSHITDVIKYIII